MIPDRLAASLRRMEGSGPIGTILVVLLACSAFVLAMPGAGLIVSETVPASSSRAIRLVGLATIAIGSIALIRQRRSLPATRRSDPTIQALVTAGVLMSSLAVLAWLWTPAAAEDEAARSHTRTVVESGGSGAGGGGEPRDMTESVRGGAGLGVASPPAGAAGAGADPGWAEGSSPAIRRGPADWLRRLMLLVFFIAAAVYALRLLPERPPAALRLELPPETATAGLRQSRAEVLYDGPDPRRQIIAAYQRLLGVLAAAGADRGEHEAPHEHLDRVLGPLGVTPAAVRRLTDLYVLAEYSTRAITSADRASAATALQTALDDVKRASTAATRRTLHAEGTA